MCIVCLSLPQARYYSSSLTRCCMCSILSLALVFPPSAVLYWYNSPLSTTRISPDHDAVNRGVMAINEFWRYNPDFGICFPTSKVNSAWIPITVRERLRVRPPCVGMNAVFACSHLACVCVCVCLRWPAVCSQLALSSFRLPTPILPPQIPVSSVSYTPCHFHYCTPYLPSNDTTTCCVQLFSPEFPSAHIRSLVFASGPGIAWIFFLFAYLFGILCCQSMPFCFRWGLGKRALAAVPPPP